MKNKIARETINNLFIFKKTKTIMQQIMFVKAMKPLEEIEFTNSNGMPDVLPKQEFVLSDGINTMVAETTGNYAKAVQQLKLKVGGYVQVNLEFAVREAKTKEGKEFNSQKVRITNIAPLWGHEEAPPEVF